MPLGAGFLRWVLACCTIEEKTKVYFAPHPPHTHFPPFTRQNKCKNVRQLQVFPFAIKEKHRQTAPVFPFAKKELHTL